MSNKSLFVQAAESTPGSTTKLAELDSKLSTLHDIYNRVPLVDPLDNPKFGPSRSGEMVNKGRNIGRLLGGLGGAAIGGYAGHALGGGLVSGASHLGHALGSWVPGYDENTYQDVANGMGDAGKLEGTLSGAAVGGYLGHAAGKHLGAGIGSIAKNFASPESQAAEKIRKMDPATALAHIRMTEQLGHESPSVLQSMKDTYNARRQGLQTQLQSGVAIPPGSRVHDIGARPSSLPV
jgi:hypothetical protein